MLTAEQARSDARRGSRIPSAICSKPSRRGNYPKWRVCVQIMPEKDAETSTEFQPVRPDQGLAAQDYPLIDVGMMELNRNPENYFAEVEQAAFEPSNIVPGMGSSPDKMLQARLLSYPDAHRYRIGVNYAEVPVNKARCPFTPITATVTCGTTTEPDRTTNPTASAARSRMRATGRIQLRSTGTATATTTATATMTTPSRAISSAF